MNLECWTDAEHPGSYCPQGLHPVHIGDSFADGRYTVAHKLGHGVSSTVWLASDATTQRYVSLKIIVAERTGSATELAILQHLESTFDDNDEGNKHVIRMLDNFVHEGPNGRHQCIVGEVLGPSLSSDISPFWDNEILPGDMVRRVSGQIALGVRYLHKRGVAHGDLHAGNILLCPPTELTSQDINTYLGQPKMRRPLDGPTSPHFPAYLVPKPEKLEFLQLCLAQPNIKICDLSEAYMPDLPCPPKLATPRIFRPPEALLNNFPHATTATDVWTLAVFFHMLFRGGCGLFYEGDDRMLREMVLHLGKLPEPWWSSWVSRGQFFDDEGRLLNEGASSTFLKVCTREMPEGGKERGMFEAALRSMVRYAPEARITADELVASEWVQAYCRPRMGDRETFSVEICEEYIKETTV